MKNFLDKIAAADFRRPAKRLVLLALAVVLVCGALSAYMFRTQLSEMAALKSAEPQSIQAAETQTGRDGDGEEHGRGREPGDLVDAGLVTPPSAAAVAVGVASIVLCGLCALAGWLMIAAWLYKASAGAGMNRALWTILGLLTDLIAVLAFLIVRGRMARCPSCGAWQKPAAYCATCGAKLQNVCPGCGKACPAAADFCPDCGAALRDKARTEAGQA